MPDLLSKIKAAVMKLLWPEDMASLPGWKQTISRMLQVIVAVVRDFLEGQLTLRAMSLVYTTLLSLVPLLALTFSVLKGFGVQNQLEPALVNTLSALGDKGEEVARQIVSFVDNIKVGVLGSLGLGMLIYTVISLLHKIEMSFNYIWHIDRPRPLGQRFSEYLSVVLVGPLLIFSALGVTASLMSSSVVQALSHMPLLGIIVQSIGTLIPYAMVIVAFTFVYIFMPNTKVHLVPALIGGAVAGIAWETAGWAFSAFVANSGNYTAIYSGFAILIMFMIWLFVSWLILLLGTSIAFYCQHPGHIAMKRDKHVLSPLMTEQLSLLVMLHIGKRYYLKQPDWQVDELARQLGAPLNLVQAVFDKLHSRGLILLTGEENPPYVPAQDMETLPISRILDAVRADEEQQGLMPWRLPRQPVVDDLMQARDAANTEALQGKSLKNMVMAELDRNAADSGKPAA